jgi:hypothetical protein
MTKSFHIDGDPAGRVHSFLVDAIAHLGDKHFSDTTYVITAVSIYTVCNDYMYCTNSLKIRPIP